MRWMGTLTLAAMLAGGVALAQQKPSPLDTPQAPAPGGKQQAQPSPQAPQGGKFAAPTPAPTPSPSAPAAPQPPAAQGKGAPPAPPAPATPPAQAAPQTPPAAPPPLAAAPPPPADEPAAVARLRTLLSADAQLSYGTAQTIDPATGSVRLTEVLIRRPGDRRVTMAELTLEGLRDDGVGEAHAREVTLRDTDANVTLARLHLSGLTVRRPNPGQDPQPGDITLDRLRLEGLRVALQDGTVVALADTALEDYGPGRQGRLALNGLDVRPPSGQAVEQVRLGRVELRGLDLAAYLGAMVAQEMPPRPTGRFSLEAEDLAIGPAERPMGGMASLRLTGEAGGGRPESASLAIRGVRVEPFPGLGEWLQRFGYQALTLDLTMEGRYEAPSGRLTVSSLSLAGRDIGALGLSYVLDGMTAEASERRDYNAVRLVSATLRYADQSLLARVMRQQAGEAGVPERQLREQYATMAAGLLTQPGRPGAGLDAIRDAVTRFIRGQAQEISLTARPPAPLSFGQVQANPPGSAADAQRLFGLGATAR